MNDIDKTIAEWRKRGERRERVYAVIVGGGLVLAAFALEIVDWLVDTWARAGVAKGFGWL